MKTHAHNLVLVLVMVLMAPVAVWGAGGAEFWIQLDADGPGTFKVYGSMSNDDNLGLAVFDLNFLNVNPNLLIANTSPAAYTWNSGTGQYDPVAGFTLMRSGSGPMPAIPLGGAQDVIHHPERTLYGVGNSVVNFSGLPGDLKMPASGIAGEARTHYPTREFTTMCELGAGTYSGAPPMIAPVPVEDIALFNLEQQPVHPDYVNLVSNYAWLAPGSRLSTSILGGTRRIGGIGAMFESIVNFATVNGTYRTPRPQELDPDLLASMPFPVPDTLQLWDISCSGSFEGPVTLTFAYDESLLPSRSSENQLCVYHHNGSGGWDALPIVDRDLLANTITVTTSSFSEFMIVPEPATFAFLVLGLAGLIRRWR